VRRQPGQGRFRAAIRVLNLALPVVTSRLAQGLRAEWRRGRCAGVSHCTIHSRV